jgi:hypothetical protein
MESSDADSDSIAAVADSIRGYLRVRPRAADTVEGIHHWWIDWEGREHSPATTEAVDIGGRQVWRACRRATPAEEGG